MGFQLVPWSDLLEKRRGQQVSGAALPGGGDGSFGRTGGSGLDELWACPLSDDKDDVAAGLAIGTAS